MKKMMIIAVMMGAMLIPAQMVAKNKVNKKPRIEYNQKNYGKNVNKKFKNDKAYKKFDNKKFNKKQVYKKRKPNKPAVVVVNRPVRRPRPLPPPPAPVKVIYQNPTNAMASAIGLAALAAIIAD